MNIFQLIEKKNLKQFVWSLTVIVNNCNDTALKFSKFGSSINLNKVYLKILIFFKFLSYKINDKVLSMSNENLLKGSLFSRDVYLPNHLSR